MSARSIVKAERLVWLDIVRLVSALMILAFHWLRASRNVGLLGRDPGPTLVTGYQGQTIGLGMLPHVLVAGKAPLTYVWLDNIIGLFGGFGWQAVSALIVVSGFSLTLALGARRLSTGGWATWIRKRAIRIIVPFYLIAIPMLVAYVAALVVFGRTHGSFAAAMSHKLHALFTSPPLGIVTSHLLLFDPYGRLLQPNFFAPAWWFVPAILVAYVIYPVLLSGVRKSAGIVLFVAAAVTVFSYTLAERQILHDQNWYFIVLQELFNFTFGVVIGSMWLDASKRKKIEGVLFARYAFPVALSVWILGIIANWSASTRPFASMLFGPGLVWTIAPLAKRIENLTATRFALRVDAYDLYLVHEPFAFPVALVLRGVFHSYTLFLGWFVFLGIAVVAARTLAAFERRVLRPRDRQQTRAVATLTRNS